MNAISLLHLIMVLSDAQIWKVWQTLLPVDHHINTYDIGQWDDFEPSVIQGFKLLISNGEKYSFETAIEMKKYFTNAPANENKFYKECILGWNLDVDKVVEKMEEIYGN